jgi:glycosyltransferase involved in cell wall biosynthesis
VAPWMAATDVMVLPSIAMEGLPRSLLEAGAMEKPVICSPVGGMPEIVENGSTGFIVPTNDTPALAEAMIRLLRDEDLRRRMGRAGRRRILQQFTEERMAANTESVYEEVLQAYSVQNSTSSRPHWRRK